jgi:Protein of unknown function (DUF4127)
MQRIRLLLLIGMCSLNLWAQKSAHTTHILLIPLDDRPPCLQFVAKMGLIGDAQLITPPRELLGRFTQYGQCDAIIAWLNKQDLSQFDAAIISMDMLAYGGLVASRVYETVFEKALRSVEIVKKIKQNYPKLPIYGSSALMRLAPTATGNNEAYREKLAHWAEYSPYLENKGIVEQLEKEIPSETISNYVTTRERNVKINQKAIELVKENVFDFLILSQDDAKPKGIHIKDRETLFSQVVEEGLSKKIAVQPGADEVSMLLLARAMTAKYMYHPKIKVIYSDNDMSNRAMPYEDRPLRETVRFHIAAVGAVEVQDTQQADILFYVFTSRHGVGKADYFMELISKPTSKGIIIADIDPKGDVQGGDTFFTEGALKRGIFQKIYGYACWNTAGNTLGTALSHGLIYAVSRNILTKKSSKKVIKRMEYAQKWYMLNRLLDDYAYHTLVRPKAQALIKENKWNPFKLTDAQTVIIKDFCFKELQPLAQNIFKKFKNTEGASLSKLTFNLPWNRTFEGEIDFIVK